MFTKYFDDFEKSFIKKGKAVKGKEAKETGKKGGKKGKAPDPKIGIDLKKFMENMDKIVPAKLRVDSIRPIDASGFSPEGTDFIVYKEFSRDIVKIMNGYVPFELVYGTYFLEDTLDRKSLESVIKRVSIVKKLNQFTDESAEKEPIVIPSFVITANTNYSLLDLKNDILNYYMSNTIEHLFEIDILMIMNKGILIKNWREKRSYVGLETKEDTMLWFFILMNEYLDAEKEHEIDFRKYVKKNTVYNQF